MIKNYFRIAFRNLTKNRMFTMLNIVGLSFGLVGFIFITTYVFDELSYDRFHTQADRIVRLNTHIHIGESKMDMALTSDVIGPILQKEYTEVEDFTRLYTSAGAKLIRKADKWINEANVAHADSSFFRIFSYQALHGHLDKALMEPNSVVLSRSAAERYFNTTDVVGKTLETNDAGNTVYQITAVIEDMPRNGHFNYDFLFTMENAPYRNWGELLSHNFTTYILLRHASDRPLLEIHLEEYVHKHGLPAAKKYMDVTDIETFRQGGNAFHYDVIPISDIHLRSNLRGELRPNSSFQYVYIFSAISLFILLIACVNFINLSTARSANRAKEVGVQKILGASRRSVAGQFLAESLLLALGGIILAIGLVAWSVPLFNELSGKEFKINDIINFKSLPLFALLLLFVGLIAGYYPAVYLSAFNPLQVLKSHTVISSGKSVFRSGLVVFQFTISIVLIVGTFIMTAQLRYIQHKKLGYERENILLINDYHALGNQTKAFRDEILNIPGIKTGTISGFLPVSHSNRSDNTYSRETVLSPSNSVQLQTWHVDEQYIPTLNLELLSGRNFAAARRADSTAVILNETAVKHFGFGKNPIGQQIHFQSGDGVESYHVIGVIKDFNFESLRDPVTPLGFFLGYSPSLAAFKIETTDLPLLLSRIEDKWNKLAPGFSFDYRFLDEAFDSMYKSERRMSRLSLTFAAMATGIACLGLFGLAAFMAEQRSKEIGIRKVLGSSVTGIVAMLCKDFVKLVFMAIIIAVPIAWWAMNKWLEDFTYRIDASWWIFILTGMIAVIIALFTVSTQAIRAARANPVDSLRNE